MKKMFILFLIAGLLSCEKEPQTSYQKLEGIAFGTTFNIAFEALDSQVTEKDIDSLIYVMNKSLSTYIPTSDISKINKGDASVVVDALFQEVFDKSAKIYRETDGAFDPTIGTLVNAWGFGPGASLTQMSQSKVDSLLVFVGFDQVILKDGKLIKNHPETYLDFNANAKGFAVDVMGRFLESKEITNYLVEIGGEIRARGVNSKNQPWRIAIEKPNFDGSRSFQTIIALENESIATSGNYRKFKIDSLSGEKYAHTIDTKTGYPSKSNLLSASVIADLDCADVDAYATAFMAMGLDKTKDFLNRRNEIKAFLIYNDGEEGLKTFATENLLLKN